MKNYSNYRILVLLTILLLCFSCVKNNVVGNKIIKSNSIIENNFISKIRKIDFIVQKSEKLEIDKKHLNYFVKTAPDNKNMYYLIQVGIMDNDRMIILYNFYCYSKTGIIKLYDPLNDSLISPDSLPKEKW